MKRTLFGLLLTCGILLPLIAGCAASKEPHELIPFLVDVKKYDIVVPNVGATRVVVVFYDFNKDGNIDLAAWYPTWVFSENPFKVDYLNEKGEIYRTLWDTDMNGIFDDDILVEPSPKKDSIQVPANTNIGELL